MCWDFFGGSGKKKKIPGGILLKFKKKKFRGDFLGGSYTGGNAGKKREDRGKKFQGARNFGGELLGEMQKKGWKKFFGGSFLNPNKL